MTRMTRLSFLVLFAIPLLVLTAPAAMAQKTLSGTITADTTLDTVGGAVYQVTGAVTVNAGVHPDHRSRGDPEIRTRPVHERVRHPLRRGRGTPPTAPSSSPPSRTTTPPWAPARTPTATAAATTPAVGDWYYLQFHNATASGSLAALLHRPLRRARQLRHGLHLDRRRADHSGHCDLELRLPGHPASAPARPRPSATRSLNRMTTVPVAMDITTDPVFDNIILDQPSGNAYDAIQIVEGGVTGIATPSPGPPPPSAACPSTAWPTGDATTSTSAWARPWISRPAWSSSSIPTSTSPTRGC